MKNMHLVTFFTAVAATAALAHDGVKNAAVQARMDGMVELQQHLKTLGNMAKGATEFDSALALEAYDGIVNESGQIVPLFEAPETDPKSEALANIWDEFAVFAEQADTLGSVSAKWLDQDLTLEVIQASIPEIGAACSACHKRFRK